jgi:hypothetical protein
MTVDLEDDNGNLVSTDSRGDRLANEQNMVLVSSDLITDKISGLNEREVLRPNPISSQVQLQVESISAGSYHDIGGNGVSSSGDDSRQETASDSAMDESVDSVYSTHLDRSISSTFAPDTTQNDSTFREVHAAQRQSMWAGDDERKDVPSISPPNQSVEMVPVAEETASHADFNEPNDPLAASGLLDQLGTAELVSLSEVESQLPSSSITAVPPLAQISNQAGFDDDSKVSTPSEADRRLTESSQESKDAGRRQIGILEVGI